MKRFRYKTEKNFFNQAKNFRKEFEDICDNPWSNKRFHWDYFYIPDQYRMIRAWADEIFSESVYESFKNKLIEFGKTYYGCTDITRPWVSFYVDGNYQNFHADVPHGPLAFVFSLTKSHKSLVGGETLLLKEETLNYWKHFDKMFGVETTNLIDRIPPKFNQLLVFDPKIPHGVREVRGPHDPKCGRLVIHGWFTNPIPSIEGARTDKRSQNQLNHFINELSPLFEEFAHLSGFLSLRFTITPDGKVTDFKFLINTLVATNTDEDAPHIFLKIIRSYFQTLNFGHLKVKNSKKGSSKNKTIVTLPLLFQSS